MTLEEARALQPGDEVTTTRGNRVTFVAMTTFTGTAQEDPEAPEGHRPGHTYNLCVVRLPNGDDTTLPPRSLHKTPRRSRTKESVQ